MIDSAADSTKSAKPPNGESAQARYPINQVMEQIKQSLNPFTQVRCSISTSPQCRLKYSATNLTVALIGLMLAAQEATVGDGRS